jgi:hypothetical protein
MKLKELTNQTTSHLRNVIPIFQPETILRLHRELVRKKWTVQHANLKEQPSSSKELELKERPGAITRSLSFSTPDAT